MTLTYPRAFPAFAVGRVKFDISRNDLTARNGTGKQSGVSLGTPLWRGEYDFEAHTDTESLAIAAWVNSLKGASKDFIATDPRRWYPAAYRSVGFAAFSGWDGTATFTLDGTKTVVTAALGSGRAGFVMAPGDLIGFKDTTGAKHHCCEVIEGGTASGGGSLVVTVNPAVWAVVAAWSGVVAYFNKPGFTARLIPSETPPVESAVEGPSTRRVSCIQYIPT